MAQTRPTVEPLGIPQIPPGGEAHLGALKVDAMTTQAQVGAAYPDLEYAEPESVDLARWAASPRPHRENSVSFSDHVETWEIPSDLWAVAARKTRQEVAAASQLAICEQIVKRQARELRWDQPQTAVDISLPPTSVDVFAKILAMALRHSMVSLRFVLGAVFANVCVVPMRDNALGERRMALRFIAAILWKTLVVLARACFGMAAVAAGGAERLTTLE